MIDIILINMIALNMSIAHEYQYGIYDCTQYSQSLNLQLRKMEYNSYCVFGLFDGNLHNWVVIRDTYRLKDTFIEATQGNIIGVINDETYQNRYIELRRGKCQ